MNVPQKKIWKTTASSGEARLAVDDSYATTWVCEPSCKAWLSISAEI